MPRNNKAHIASSADRTYITTARTRDSSSRILRFLAVCILLLSCWPLFWKTIWVHVPLQMSTYKRELNLGSIFIDRVPTFPDSLPIMRSVLLTALAFCATAFGQLSLDDYISRQLPISKAGILANIGPLGSKSHGAKAGIVIASPSTHDPDYVYTWTRDASLVFKALTEQYIRGDDTSPALRTLLDQFVQSQTELQKVSNPSGTITTGGLGEPKFNIDMSPYTGAWGRPQRDGPPLRATAIIMYGNWLLDQQNTTYVKQKLWPVIKLDLDYTAQTWNNTGFDLWEEVSSSSYFTTAVQARALVEGAIFAERIGETAVVANYKTQAANALCFAQSYWNPNGRYITANTGGGRSGKDANPGIASNHNFDPSLGCDAVTLQPCSDKALANLKAYVDAFRSIYPINNGIPSSQAVATGRYPEDVYYGGQPWYLTTLGVAEQLYNALITWKKQGFVEITSISLPFFQQIVPSAAVGKYESTTSTYTTLTNAVKTYADGFINVVQKYTPSNGALAEQYHRNNGAQLSAKDLTWSYAAFVTAIAARNGFEPHTWGAADVQLPSVCSTGPGSGPGVPVTFNVQANTVWGESIYLTGSIDALRTWSPSNAIALSSANYPTWTVTVNIPPNTLFEYKFIRKNGDSVTWESDPNRSRTSPASGGLTINDGWR
ncbi:hypothetical protein CVT24_004520 [Panaeolus cyanescens]|uniref:Glucoamylase n=1 Tax=Panaeolus cyanescens TaxID=181874 RepID=A0A409YBT8_9AGAR|nr:hypothetical protein CVT24_004520 [Panaeolus cyanescens]